MPSKKRSSKKKLTPRMQAFVDAHLLEPNATKAAIQAGYSERSAGSQAHDLLKKPEIQAALADARKKASEQAVVSKAEVLRGLKLEATSAENDSARVSAWVALGKTLGIFVDKVEHQVKSWGELVEESMGGEP